MTVGTLTLFPVEQMGLAALTGMRLTGLLWVAPLFSARPIPFQMKTAILVLLTLVMIPVAAEGAPGGAAVNPVTVVGELVVGIVLGLSAGIFIAAAESAGDMMAVQMGLSGANVLDPLSSTQMPILGQFLGLFVLTIILSAGGHLIILEALATSLEVAPVGAPLALDAGIMGFIDLGASLFVLGLRFAAPVIAAMMIGNAALGVMARTVPQMNVLMLSFPLQIAIGLFTLAAALPLMARFVAGFESHYGQIVSPMIRSLAPVAGGA